MSCICCKSMDTVEDPVNRIKPDKDDNKHVPVAPTDLSSRRHCVPCLEKRRYAYAVAKCESCVAHLCKNCLQIHRRTQATRSHKININIDAYEEAKHSVVDKDMILKEINDLQVKFVLDKERNQVLLNERKKQVVDTVNVVKEFRDKLNAMLDKLEKDTLDEVHTIADREISTINTHISYITACILQLNLESKRLVKARKKNKHAYMFENADKTVKEYTIKRTDVETVEDDVSLTFVANSKIETMFGKLGMLGEVRTEAATAWAFNDITSTQVETFDTKIGAERNTKGYWITGLATIPNGNILISDQRNNTIKMFDKLYQYLDILKLDHRPFDVAVISENRAVCTLPYRTRIQFIKLAETWLERETTTTDIHTGDECYGVAYCDEQLVVGIRDSTTFLSRVDVMDFSGVITASVSHNSVGEALFADPQYVAVDQRRGVIYISDQEKKCIVIANIDGTYVTTVSIATGFTLGIDVDFVGNVYVCQSNGHVQIMARDGSSPRPLLMKSHGIRNPQAICFDVTRRQLFVSLAGNPYVRVFGLRSGTELSSHIEI